MTDPESLEPRAEEPAPPQEPPEEIPFWSWLDLAVLACLALPLLVATSMAAYPLGRLAPQVKALTPIAAMALFYALWFLALYALIRMHYGRTFWDSLGWIAPPGGLLVPFVWGALTAFGGVALGAALRPPKIETPFQALLQDPVSLILVGVVVVSAA